MLFASLFRDKYRAHFEEEAYVYVHGPWRRVSSIPYESLEFATTTFREAERCFLLMQSDFPTPERTFGAVSQSLRLILTSNAVLDVPADGLARNQSASLWHNGPAKLCDAMFRNFADPGRDRVVLANYRKRASEPYPPNMGGWTSQTSSSTFQLEIPGVANLYAYGR